MDVPAFQETLPRDASRLRSLRAAIAAWLDRAGVNGDDRDAVILATHEATANAIEHATAGGEVDVRAELGPDAITVVVRIPGRWRDPEPKRGRGNGLAIIRALTEAVVEPAATSSTVRMRRSLAARR